jgi:Domain of unknown function (DUF4145)
MAAKYVAPSAKLDSFNCPYCQTLAHQTWYSTLASADEDDNKPPRVSYSEAEIEHLEDNTKTMHLADLAKKVNSGLIFPHATDQHYGKSIWNLNISHCYSCKQYAIWLHDKLLHPPVALHVECNPDIPDEIRYDFEEARSIFFLSPRGSAALLRLAAQKLCVLLGEQGKKIDDDIASLVKKGLPVKVQKALGTVRVIGNEAVHPGQVDLTDTPEIAQSLFDLLNIIADEMISKPKKIDEMFARLPENKKAAIAKRDR